VYLCVLALLCDNRQLFPDDWFLVGDEVYFRLLSEKCWFLLLFISTNRNVTEEPLDYFLLLWRFTSTALIRAIIYFQKPRKEALTWLQSGATPTERNVFFGKVCSWTTLSILGSATRVSSCLLGVGRCLWKVNLK